jgi:hypothetical protein
MLATTEISIYRNAKDNKGEEKPRNIEQIIELIRSDTFDSVTKQYRKILSEVDKKTTEGKKAIRDFKEFNFKGVTWSGTFNHRKTDGIMKHSGLICLDIDGRDKFGNVINGLYNDEELNRLRFRLINDNFSFIVFISPSGQGLKVIFKIDCLTAKDHKEKYFPLLEKYFFDCYDVKIDPSGKNVDRLCFLPCDPNVYVNYDSDIFTLNSTVVNEEGETEFIDIDTKIKFCIQELKDKNIDITSDYDNWRNIGFAFASLGEYGRDYFHQVSQLYPGYDAEETDYKFNNFIATRSGKIGIQTFFYHCKKAGINFSKITDNSPQAIKRREDYQEIYKHAHALNHAGRKWTTDDIKFFANKLYINPEKIETIFKKVFEEFKEEHNIDNKPEIARVEIFLKKHYEMYRNEITTRIEVRLKNEPQVNNFDKINADSIFRHLQHENFKFPIDKLKSLLKSDFIPVKNPFKEYFFNLPEWDGVDYIAKLASYIKTDDQEFWEIMFKKALVRSIACAIGDRENRIVMVLVQEDQNSGKSSFIRFLNPFGDKYYTEAPLRDGKDTEFRFSENFIYNLEELSALGALDINKLKAIISKSMVKERRAYAEFEEEYPRRCNFWGSTNKTEFLTDTQNTRWICIKVNSIDFGYNNLKTGEAAINIHDVYTQAYALYKSGFDYDLTKEEAARRDIMNKIYEQSSNEKDLIVKYYIPCEKNRGKFLSVAEIEIELIIKTDNKLKNMNRAALGRALTQLGFISEIKKINGHTTRGYWLNEITDTTISENGTIQGNLLTASDQDDDLPF